MEQGTLAKGTGVSSLLFGVYTILLALLGLTLAYQGGALVNAGGSPYYAMMGTVLLLAAALMGLKKAVGIYLYGAASLATYGWAIWESSYNGWAYIPRLAWLILLSVIFLAFWPLVRRDFAKINKALYFSIMGVLPLLMAATILAPLFFPNTVHLADSPAITAHSQQPFSRSTVASPDANVAASHDKTNWTAYAGSNLGNHYSAAAQITPANVSGLVKAWEYHHGDVKQPGEKTKYLNEATPIKVGDSLYTCTPKQIIISLNATTGKENWRYDSKVDPGYFANGGAYCRGVSYYEVPNASGLCAKRIIWGTNDIRLGAVDALTGQACPDFGTAGFADLKDGLGTFRKGSTGITSAPLVIRGVVITGGRVLDSDVRPAPSGVVRAYDAVSGKQKWAWDLGRPDSTAPAEADETYTLSTPNSWAPISADDELGLVYITTGNAAGDFYGGTRTEQEDTFSSSLVALDALTGKVKWHFQTVHHDLWDYDLSPQPALIDFPTANGTRPAVIQATKSGQLFVLDRTTGEPLVDISEAAVPQGTAPGDYTAATQPLSPGMPSTMGRPSKNPEVLNEADAWGLTPFDQLQCRIEFRQARYEGIFTPPVVGQQSLIFPGHHGGLNWGGVMVDLQRGLLIINNQRLPYMQGLVPREQLDAINAKSFQESPGNNQGFRVQAGLPYGAIKDPWMSALEQPCIAPPWGFISAIDLRTREVRWSRPFGTGYDSGPLGIASKLRFEIGTPSDATGVATAGGVTFIGAAIDRFMRAYNSESGELLWEERLPAGNQASPLTYVSEGRQYVVAVVGGHDRIPTKLGDSIIAWALPEK